MVFLNFLVLGIVAPYLLCLYQNTNSIFYYSYLNTFKSICICNLSFCNGKYLYLQLKYSMKVL